MITGLSYHIVDYTVVVPAPAPAQVNYFSVLRASLQLFYYSDLNVYLLQARSDTNKGYGFIEYYNQACAEYAKKKMSTPEFKLDKNAPNVSWTDTKNGGNLPLLHRF